MKTFCGMRMRTWKDPMMGDEPNKLDSIFARIEYLKCYWLMWWRIDGNLLCRWTFCSNMQWLYFFFVSWTTNIDTWQISSLLSIKIYFITISTLCDNTYLLLPQRNKYLQSNNNDFVKRPNAWWRVFNQIERQKSW